MIKSAACLSACLPACFAGLPACLPAGQSPSTLSPRAVGGRGELKVELIEERNSPGENRSYFTIKIRLNTVKSNDVDSTINITASVMSHM